MSLLRGTRKLLLAAGLAGCGAAAAVLLSGLNAESDGFKTRAANVIQNHFNDYSYTGNLMNSVHKWDNNWDKRDPFSLVKPISGSFRVSEKDENNYNEKLEKAKAVATRHLILIRHGQYNLSGETDNLRKLTPLGRDQAYHVGIRLKDLALPYTRIIQSTMTRATETAQIISQHLPNIPVDSCNFIREGSPIQPDPPVHHWRPEQKFFEDGARIEAAFRKYFHRADPQQKKDSYEIMVCHANVIRYFVCRALQFPPEAWLRFSLHNCSLTWIAIRPSGRVTVYTVGDIGHVPPNKMTTS
ncbi:serine/threonine-protein phosphatase PGAM5, mitochondrial-like isoform X2 [Oppia nitens]|uniref:serine/threonine-protein phosphatase PGAM5, mitochondrial-like isoform X2 n=1 Tax=Oppia nitens TaxID=1686743 RepID=UPI0023DC791E|nr:serine/threonine-protein phosphatase PGAM5, mitochondrial-like isoform X2 [Oppia nitens]